MTQSPKPSHSHFYEWLRISKDKRILEEIFRIAFDMKDDNLDFIFSESGNSAIKIIVKNNYVGFSEYDKKALSMEIKYCFSEIVMGYFRNEEIYSYSLRNLMELSSYIEKESEAFMEKHYKKHTPPVIVADEKSLQGIIQALQELPDSDRFEVGYTLVRPFNIYEIRPPYADQSPIHCHAEFIVYEEAPVSSGDIRRIEAYKQSGKIRKVWTFFRIINQS